jgi:hypothetical protein
VYGVDWSCKAPIKLVHAAYAKSKQQQHEEVVVLSKVLAADINLGYQDIGNIQVLAVNGAKVSAFHCCLPKLFDCQLTPCAVLFHGMPALCSMLAPPWMCCLQYACSCLGCAVCGMLALLCVCWACCTLC